MNSGGIGSASIVLVFAVLCLTIFSVISLVPALTSQRLIEAEMQLVQDFYNADTLAEQILAEILAADFVPDSALGVDISAYWDWDLLAEVVSFYYMVTETRMLHVELILDYNAYQITSWRMYDLAEWEAYDRLNVWTGDLDDFFFSNF